MLLCGAAMKQVMQFIALVTILEQRVATMLGTVLQKLPNLVFSSHRQRIALFLLHCTGVREREHLPEGFRQFTLAMKESCAGNNKLADIMKMHDLLFATLMMEKKASERVCIVCLSTVSWH